MTSRASILLLLAQIVGCASPQAADHPLTAPGLSSTPTAWPTSTQTEPLASDRKTYVDSEYDFTVSYPSHFQVWKPLYNDGRYPRKVVRIADRKFPQETYADGGITILVFPKDAQTLPAWLDKHEFHSGDEDDYFDDVSDVQQSELQGRDAIEFNYAPGEVWRIHALAVFHGDWVLLLNWWSETQQYGSTIQPIWQQMLTSVRL
jgi:hypothetical protein